MKAAEDLVLEIIANAVPVNFRGKVALSSNLTEDLGFNSLKLLSLSLELEKKANFDVLRASEEADLSGIRTVSDVSVMVRRYQKNA